MTREEAAHMVPICVTGTAVIHFMDTYEVLPKTLEEPSLIEKRLAFAIKDNLSDDFREVTVFIRGFGIEKLEPVKLGQLEVEVTP